MSWGLQSALAIALGATVLVWLGVAAYVLAGRAVHELRDRWVRGASLALDPAALATTDPSERAARAAEMLARLPRRAIERVAADTTAPPWLRAAFSRHALARGDERLLNAAEHHDGERSKWRRIAALRILAAADHPRAVHLLRRALASTDADVVATALSALGELGTDDAAALLVEALRDEAAPRSRVAAHLDELEADVDARLLPLLYDRDAGLRFWAATLLARYAGRDVVRAELVARASDEDANVRTAVAEALGAAAGPDAVAAVEGLVADPVWYVRAHAARSLARLDRASLARLVPPLLGDERWWVRAAAKEALATLGGDALAALRPYLGHRDRFVQNGAAEVLQNVGVLDELVLAAARSPHAHDHLATLRSLLAAGGFRLVAGSASRVAFGERAAVRRVLAELGGEAAVA